MKNICLDSILNLNSAYKLSNYFKTVNSTIKSYLFNLLFVLSETKKDDKKEEKLVEEEEEGDESEDFDEDDSDYEPPDVLYCICKQPHGNR